MPIGDAFQAYIQQRQNRQLMDRQARLQQGQNDRLMQQEMLRALLLQGSPAMLRENRLKGQFATRQKDAESQDAAWLRALMLADPATIAPELRPRLKAYQEYYNAHPTGSGKIIQQFLSQGKPHPMQLKAIQTMGPDGLPETTYSLWDPNNPKAGIEAPSAGISTNSADSLGPTLPPPTPEGAPDDGGLSPDAAALGKEYDLP